MKYKILAIVLTMVFGSSAQAQVGHWSGYYFGVSATSSNMTVEDLSFGTGAFEPGGFSSGGFTGMNHQISGLVLGAEAGFEGANISGRDGANMDPFRANSQLSFRGRVGVDAGKAMPYFLVGYVASRFEADHDGNGANIANFTASGISYGIGVDLKVNRSNTRFVRVEYQATDYSGGVFQFGGADDHDVLASSQRVSVGYGISF